MSSGGSEYKPNPYALQQQYDQMNALWTGAGSERQNAAYNLNTWHPAMRDVDKLLYSNFSEKGKNWIGGMSGKDATGEWTPFFVAGQPSSYFNNEKLGNWGTHRGVEYDPVEAPRFESAQYKPFGGPTNTGSNQIYSPLSSPTNVGLPGTPTQNSASKGPTFNTPK